MTRTICSTMPGSYTVHAFAPRLALRQPAKVELKSRTQSLNLLLNVSAEKQEVTRHVDTIALGLSRSSLPCDRLPLRVHQDLQLPTVHRFRRLAAAHRLDLSVIELKVFDQIPTSQH